jgi:hypothetical protein
LLHWFLFVNKTSWRKTQVKSNMIVPCYVYFLVLCRDGRYDFRVKTIFGSSLSSYLGFVLVCIMADIL